MTAPPVSSRPTRTTHPRFEETGTDIVARLIEQGAGVIKAGKIAKRAMRTGTTDPLATAEHMWAEHLANRACADADREYGRLDLRDPTGEQATYSVLVAGMTKGRAVTATRPSTDI